MITDSETNKVYLAEGIQGYSKVAEKLLWALYEEGIEMDYLPYSASKKHVWARDYMPIQLEEGRFAQYVYNPDYLRSDPDYIPRYGSISKKLGLQCESTKLIIDGGNVVKGKWSVIMTDKVLKENAMFNESYVLGQLEKVFECWVKIIPWDRYEIFGHADGMVRFIEGSTVLLNNYIDFDKELRKKLIEKLRWYGLSVEELHYDIPRVSKFSWAYLNFLQVKNRIFVPGLGIREDELAARQIQEYFPDHKVLIVPECQDLVRDGGALNCVSWNIKEVLEKETACKQELSQKA